VVVGESIHRPVWDYWDEAMEKIQGLHAELVQGPEGHLDGLLVGGQKDAVDVEQPE